MCVCVCVCVSVCQVAKVAQVAKVDTLPGRRGEILNVSLNGPLDHRTAPSHRTHRTVAESVEDEADLGP